MYDILIFDDGLQDMKIDYDLKLVCLNQKIDWKWTILPAGPLRKTSSLKGLMLFF